MTDYISRADAVPFDIQLQSTREVLDQFAKDRVKVVRCKDCRYCTEHYDRDGYPYWMCKEWDGGTDADGYCHCGESKGGDSK